MKLPVKLLLFCLILILSLNILYSQPKWQRVASPTTKWLYKCSFTDSLNGWAAGDSGIIIHTSNAGADWVIQQTGIDYFIEDIFFLNTRLGWAISNDFLSYGPMILKTTNGGNNWNVTRYPDSNLVLITVNFLDSLNGYFGGSSGTILKTTNAGFNWIKCSLESSFFSYFPIRKFSFSNSQYGLACGGIIDINGLIWRTTDYGYNWAIMDTTLEPINDIMFYNDQIVLAAGGDYEYGGAFYKSTDGGINWADSIIGIFGSGHCIAPRSLQEMWISLGFSQLWMVSIDGGYSWLSYNTPDSSAIYDAVFIDSLRGWAFGTYGGIFKYNPEGEIGIKNIKIPESANLFQNYPNPFNPKTTIGYRILKSSKVKIILFDVLGREVKVLVDDYKLPGYYELEVISDELSSGVYFYKLVVDSDGEAGDYFATKKMVITK
ncbi:MAG: T9SS C-terminal target domain-containing protein [Ignavibacteriae bacterium]|nr:MAG: T9SS C-terminal target domain-containing protein [Ignavibacteriota bacterium]